MPDRRPDWLIAIAAVVTAITGIFGLRIKHAQEKSHLSQADASTTSTTSYRVSQDPGLQPLFSSPSVGTVLPSSQATPVVLHQGIVTVEPYRGIVEAFDLDQWAINFAQYSELLNHTDILKVGGAQALLARIGAFPPGSYEQCSSDSLDWVSSIAYVSIKPHDELCVRTTDGRTGLMEVLALPSGEDRNLRVKATVWKKVDE